VETRPELLARHCAEAGLVEKSIFYWLVAGRLARQRCAMTEAVAQLRNGLGLLSKVADAAVRQEQELNLQIALGNALMATKGWSAPESGRAFARARELCEQLDRQHLLGPVLEGQWAFRFTRGDLDQAERHAEEICHLGEVRIDTRLKCLGSSLSGYTCLAFGKFIDARASYENALSLWNPTDHAFAVSSEGRAMILINLFKTLLCLGHVDQARFRRDEALAEARWRSPYHRANVLCHAWHGDWAMEGGKSAQTMLQSADEILALSSEQGFPLATGVGNITRGWCLGTLGRAAEGIPLLLSGLAKCRDAGCTVVVPFLLTTIADAYRLARQPELALHRLAEAEHLTEATQERWAEAEMHRLRGTLLVDMRKSREAEESYHRALAVAPGHRDRARYRRRRRPPPHRYSSARPRRSCRRGSRPTLAPRICG
jgi:predicted ATPase